MILSASHSHSGPGAITSEFLWSIAPATDLMVPEVTEQMQTNLANVMTQSQEALEPAKLDVGTFDLTGVTVNRRCHISKFVNCHTIDPNLGILRVDKLNGETLAVVWNCEGFLLFFCSLVFTPFSCYARNVFGCFKLDAIGRHYGKCKHVHGNPAS